MRQKILKILGMIGMITFSSALTYSILSSSIFFVLASTLGLILSASLIFPESRTWEPNRIEMLDEDEYKILMMLRKGYSKSKIAATLNISRPTLYQKLKNLKEKGLISNETFSRGD